jgi:hypothetical protein
VPLNIFQWWDGYRTCFACEGPWVRSLVKAIMADPPFFHFLYLIPAGTILAIWQLCKAKFDVSLAAFVVIAFSFVSFRLYFVFY